MPVNLKYTYVSTKQCVYLFKVVQKHYSFEGTNGKLKFFQKPIVNSDILCFNNPT